MARFWEALYLPKIEENRSRCPKSRLWDAFWMRLVSRTVFGMVFNRVWEDFKRILEGFGRNLAEACLVAELTLMISATRGRSFDPSSDGWIV